jgi:hypothetical protein
LAESVARNEGSVMAVWRQIDDGRPVQPPGFVTLVEHWAVTLGPNGVTAGPATGTPA